MPFDSYGSSLESKICDLEKWITALLNAPVKDPQPHLANQFTDKIRIEIRQHLIRERDTLQRQLDRHRRRDAERGIKY